MLKNDHTSLLFGVALMQIGENFLYQMLDVTSLWPSDKLLFLSPLVVCGPTPDSPELYTERCRNKYCTL